jgi:DNA segregation ATPase FtsK/SpoIIIE, S-DNA-T family
VKMSAYSGQQLAQVDNPDPFAPPVWRSPIYHTPGWIIVVMQLARVLLALVKFLARHAVLDLVLAVEAFAWSVAGWPGPAILTGTVTAALIIWRVRWPATFSRFISSPLRGKWRGWHYQRHWLAVLTIARLVPVYRGQVLVPVLGKVRSTRFTDRVPVRLVSGQAAADFAARAENLAHGFGALLCRVRTARPGFLILEFVRRDALAAIIPALAVPECADLRALAVGRREDGSPWLARLHGTHLLIAGATGAGKGSVLWSLIRAMLGLLQAGLVKILAADPKVMELAYGRAIFDTCGQYAATPEAIVLMLEAAVRDMQARAAKLAGKQRDHTPTLEFPFVVVLV